MFFFELVRVAATLTGLYDSCRQPEGLWAKASPFGQTRVPLVRWKGIARKRAPA
jgi:hypothetical protein